MSHAAHVAHAYGGVTHDICSNAVRVLYSAADRKPWTKAEAEVYRGFNMGQYTFVQLERKAAQDMLTAQKKEALEQKKQAIQTKYPVWPVFRGRGGSASIDGDPFDHHSPGG